MHLLNVRSNAESRPSSTEPDQEQLRGRDGEGQAHLLLVEPVLEPRRVADLELAGASVTGAAYPGLLVFGGEGRAVLAV